MNGVIIFPGNNGIVPRTTVTDDEDGNSSVDSQATVEYVPNQPDSDDDDMSMRTIDSDRSDSTIDLTQGTDDVPVEISFENGKLSHFLKNYAIEVEVLLTTISTTMTTTSRRREMK